MALGCSVSTSNFIADPNAATLRTPIVRRVIAGIIALSSSACAPNAGAQSGAVGSTKSADGGPHASMVLRGARLTSGRAVDVFVRDGRIERLDPHDMTRSSTGAVDLTGHWLAPGWIDNHVHLTYFPVASKLAANGVVAAVDLAAPLHAFDDPKGPIRVVRSGPMLTAVGGYPTRGWGRDGYGLEVSSPEAARSAVAALVDRGARLIKVAVAGAPSLDDATLVATVVEAHRLGVQVAAHALDDGAARRAAAAGVDVLAHTPVRPLSEQTIRAWSGRAVISTLAAFGGSDATIDNLRRLRAAGAQVLYGTDLGNTNHPGVDPNEIRLLMTAGLDGAALLEANEAAARRWDLDGLGSLEIGSQASLLVLDANPVVDPVALTRPVGVMIDGVWSRRPRIARRTRKAGLRCSVNLACGHGSDRPSPASTP